VQSSEKAAASVSGLVGLLSKRNVKVPQKPTKINPVANHG
jgi:hypothetical protein